MNSKIIKITKINEKDNKINTLAHPPKR